MFAGKLTHKFRHIGLKTPDDRYVDKLGIAAMMPPDIIAPAPHCIDCGHPYPLLSSIKGHRNLSSKIFNIFLSFFLQ